MDPLTSQPSQEYPIRALVLFRAATAPRLLGTVMNMRHCAEPGCRCGGYWAQDKVTNADHYFTAKEVIIDPSPAQIAEERAKAGLPAEPSEGKKDLEPSAEASEGRGARPKIFIFINGSFGFDRDVIAEAIAEDGTTLTQHCSSNELWSKHDMGLTSDWKHDEYNKHYPHGWELVWVETADRDKHPGLLAALARNRTKASLPAAEGEALPERSEGAPSLPSAPSVPVQMRTPDRHLIVNMDPERVAAALADGYTLVEAAPSVTMGGEPTLGDALKVVFMAGFDAGYSNADDSYPGPDAEEAWIAFMDNKAEADRHG